MSYRELNKAQIASLAEVARFGTLRSTERIAFCRGTSEDAELKRLHRLASRGLVKLVRSWPNYLWQVTDAGRRTLKTVTTDTSHLVIRIDGVLCMRCMQLEPVHAGHGTPMPALLLAYEALAKRHPSTLHRARAREGLRRP